MNVIFLFQTSRLPMNELFFMLCNIHTYVNVGKLPNELDFKK